MAGVGRGVLAGSDADDSGDDADEKTDDDSDGSAGGGEGSEGDGGEGDGGVITLNGGQVRITGAEYGVDEPLATGTRMRCINGEALWTLSSARPGNALPELLDGDVSRRLARRKGGGRGGAGGLTQGES
jgi:hypothetical protein